MRPRITMSTRSWILLGVLALLVGALWFGRPEGPNESREASPRSEQLGEPPLVRIGLLTPKKAGSEWHDRNLFQFYEPQKPPAPTLPTVTVPTPTGKEVTVPTETIPTAVVDPGPPPPRFTYIGFLGPKDQKIAVFDRGADVMVARVGDLVSDNFELLEFRYEAVVLAYRDGKYKGKTATLTRRPG